MIIKAPIPCPLCGGKAIWNPYNHSHECSRCEARIIAQVFK